MLLHNLCIDPIIANCHRFSENFFTQNYYIYDHDTRQKNIYIHKDIHLRSEVEEEYDVMECLFSTKLSH